MGSDGMKVMMNKVGMGIGIGIGSTALIATDTKAIDNSSFGAYIATLRISKGRLELALPIGFPAVIRFCLAISVQSGLGCGLGSGPIPTKIFSNLDKAADTDVFPALCLKDWRPSRLMSCGNSPID
jgi:hypothetical protein